MAEHAERLTYTLSLERLLTRSDVVFVAVDTPPTYSGDADLSRVMGVVDELERVGADARHVLVMKSTVPVGTGERVRAELDARGLGEVGYCSNPEFLKEGAAIEDFLHPDRVVIGAFDPAQGDRVESLYRSLGAPVVRTSVPSAEMVKYASNAFLATKISFINEIANVCEEVGADVSVVAHGMGLDARIGKSFLRAGIGFGGSCFPKDVAALKQLAGNSGYHFQLLTSVIEVNELQKRRVIGKLKKHLGSLEGKRVALLGLAFKPETDDMREAPSLTVVRALCRAGARVRAHDPEAGHEARHYFAELLESGALTLCEHNYDCLGGADALLVLTEWAPYRNPDFPRIAAELKQPAVVFDGRNLWDPARMAELGFLYFSVGRPTAQPHAPAARPDAAVAA
jgi:UDPglucose 6-dehydrogenase